MVIRRKLTEEDAISWTEEFLKQQKHPASSLGERFLADNFPGHVDNRFAGESTVEQIRIIKDNYVVPKDST